MGPVVLAVVAGAVALSLIAGLGYVAVESIMLKTKLTPDGTVSLDGKTPADPAVLAEAAGLDLDTYALARMIMSEAGGLPEQAKLGVGFAALTYASDHNRTITAQLLRADGAANGYFGRQDQGRYASTSQDPNPAAVAAAQLVTGGATEDPTGGADQWDSPWSYKDNPNTGETAAEKAARVAQSRLDAGKQMVVIGSVPERKLRFWRDG